MSTNAPRIDFSYTVFWTKHALTWTPDQRRAVLAATETVIAHPDFQANAYARRFEVPGLNTVLANSQQTAHAGASLLALRHVLHSFTTP